MTQDLLADGTRAAAEFGLTWACQSSALLALGLVAGRMLRPSGPAVQSAVYRTTLAAVLLCPVASMFLPRIGLGGVTIYLPTPEVAAAAPVQALPIAAQPAPIEPIKAAPPSGPAPMTHAVPSPAVVETPPAAPPAVPAPPVESGPGGLSTLVAVGLVVWVLGAALIGVRMAVAARRMRRLRASAIPAEPEAEALCRDLAGRMKLDPPGVLRSPLLPGPCLDGLRRPAILLPEDDAGPDLPATIAHELAHLARRDCLWNLLRHAASGLLWFQPLIWVLSRRIEVAAEEVCDDHVVQLGTDRARYAGLLVELAGRALPPLSPTGVGLVSLRSLLARRVVRILDSSRVLSTRAGARALVATLAAGLAGTILVGLIAVGGRDNPARADETQAPAAEAGTRTVSSRVIALDGQPIPGAVVTVVAATGTPDEVNPTGRRSKIRHREVARTVADGDGRFSITFREPGPEQREDITIYASAPGYGVAPFVSGRMTRLAPDDAPVTGRLVDLEGRPIAGASARVVEVQMPWPETTPPNPDPTRFDVTRSLGYGIVPPSLAETISTDADGRFRIVGLGRGRMARLEITGPGIVPRRVQVVTRTTGPIAGPAPAAESRGFDDPVEYGANCVIVMEPSRPIEGVVRDILTGEPIPDALVTSGHLAGSNLSIEGELTARTDAQGRYRLDGMPKGDGHAVSIYPPLDRPYFITRFLRVPAGPGLGPVTFDVGLRRGIWVTGRVADRTNDKPVAASVSYFPMLDNPAAKDYPNFRPEINMSVAIQDRYQTDRDGRFRVVGLPGRGVVAAHCTDREYRVGAGADLIAGRTERGQLPTYDRIFARLYQAIHEVDIPAGVAEYRRDLPLDPGGVVMVRLVDEAGEPVAGAIADGRYPASVDSGDRNLYDGNTTKVAGLEPGETRTVLFRQQERGLAAALVLPPDGPRDGREVTVVLRPQATISGRLVDAGGNAVAGVVEVRGVRTDVPGVDFREMAIEDARLDAEGRFRVAVPPGGTYKIRATSRVNQGIGVGMEPESFPAFSIPDVTAPKPGEAIDMGTFDVTTGKRVAAAEPAEAAKPQTADVPITGRIIDLEGRPVVGVTIKTADYQTPKSGDLTPWLDGVRKGQPPWIVGQRFVDWHKEAPEAARRGAKTDADGRFRIDGLGAETIVQLQIEGETIAHTSILAVTRRMAPIPASGYGNHYGPGSLTVYGADFTYTAGPGRAVEGVVKDAKTNQPLVGAEIRSDQFAGSEWVGIMTLRTRTDANGRFRLASLPKGPGNQLLIVPSDEQPYLLQEVKLPDPPGVGVVPIEVALTRGVWIEGKITEEGTGKPVAGAWLHYLPFRDNPFAQAHPSFDQHGNTDGTGFQDRYLSKADGSFRLVGLPGRAIVGAIEYHDKHLQGVGSESIAGLVKDHHFPTYRNPVNPGKLWPTVMKEINPPADAESVHVDFEVKTGPSVRFAVVDPEGHPVAGGSTRGLSGRSSWEREAMPTPEGVATNLMPGEERIVTVELKDRKFGKAVRVREGDDARGPVVVRVEPLATMTGLVVDADGQPVARATVRPDVLPGGDFSMSLSQVTTDEQGRFVVPNVLTGCEYSLGVETTGPIRQRRFVASKNVTVRPGETTDVGEIRFKKD